MCSMASLGLKANLESQYGKIKSLNYTTGAGPQSLAEVKGTS